MVAWLPNPWQHGILCPYSRSHSSCYLLRVRLEELQRRGSDLAAIAARHGASNLRVFGSVARGQATASSDVDFLVRMERGRTLLDLSRLKLELEQLLGCSVDLVSEDALSPRMKTRVLDHARPL